MGRAGLGVLLVLGGILAAAMVLRGSPRAVGAMVVNAL